MKDAKAEKPAGLEISINISPAVKTVTSAFISKIDTYCREHPYHRITPKQMYRLIYGTTNDNITPTSMKELDDYISMLNDLDCEICVIDEREKRTCKGKLIRIITTQETMDGALIDQYYELARSSLLANIEDLIPGINYEDMLAALDEGEVK